MKFLTALTSGLAGAGALTLIHETSRRYFPNAPRMDKLGMEAISKIMRTVDTTPPSEESLHRAALGGDLVSNTLYYSLVGVGDPDDSLMRGAILGLVAGVGAVVLPPFLGLQQEPASRTNATKMMTVAWYLAGGLVAGAAHQMLAASNGKEAGRRL